MAAKTPLITSSSRPADSYYPSALHEEALARLAYLAEKGITDTSALMPPEIFSWSNLFTLRGLIFFVIGGFMVGFGTRYAGGCTSGHAIMGLSSLQWPSLVATVMFMVGGIAMTWFILPYLLTL